MVGPAQALRIVFILSVSRVDVGAATLPLRPGARRVPHGPPGARTGPPNGPPSIRRGRGAPGRSVRCIRTLPGVTDAALKPRPRTGHSVARGPDAALTWRSPASRPLARRRRDALHRGGQGQAEAG